MKTPVNHALPNLQIRFHLVDGDTVVFVQHDPAEVKKVLESFQSVQIFDRHRFVITDGDSITSLPASKITRIDLITEQLTQLMFPTGMVDVVELNDTEFKTLIRNPTVLKQWGQLRTREDCLVAFLDLEMANGEQLFLTTEMHIELQSQALWNSPWFPLEGSSLCFRMRSGGVAALNLANLVRLTFFPKPEHAIPDAWHARKHSTPHIANLGPGASSAQFGMASQATNLQAREVRQ